MNAKNWTENEKSDENWFTNSYMLYEWKTNYLQFDGSDTLLESSNVASMLTNFQKIISTNCNNKWQRQFFFPVSMTICFCNESLC